ncbi:MAG: cation-translocating P-type ATPase [Chloroflexota bacterium]
MKQTAFEINALQGLSDEDVIARLARDGYNELPSSEKRTLFHILFEVIREPMFLLLIACGTLYLLLGDVQEAMLLLGFVFVVIGITIYQEQKTEKALDALRDLSSPRALVIRNGAQQRIAGKDVVADDIILISEGDRVPADAVLLSCTNLNVDESLLTGESVSVRKTAWDGVSEMGRPGGDDLPFVYSGTMVVKGQAIGQVRSTGVRTEMGKIGKALQTLETEDTNLQKQTGMIVKRFATVGIILCVIVVVVFGMTRNDWLGGILAGITLAMATLPEEFPVVMTIFLALGAWRISQRKVLTRRMYAVEMLGAATVLCTDKTGTLTLNRMTIVNVCINKQYYDISMQQVALPEEVHEAVEYSILASPSDPFDPMEKAMQELGARTLLNTEHLHRDWTLLHEYPLSEKLLAMSRVWQSPDGEDLVIASKGAPEAIANLCHVTPQQSLEINECIESLASQGLRVIGVAKALFKKEELPSEQHDFDFQMVGLLGIADPVRPGVPEAVQECYTAGIRVIMITGDYPATARSIAAQIGLKPLDDIITGPELEKMTEEELRRRISKTCIFARAVPEQKLRIVAALKANGEVVAMTGDGVNDAPALKAAHIGIAMGGRGTDVARESGALVLLDDNFASIVSAVRMGRRIFDNLKKAMTFIFSVHIPIAGMSLIPVLFRWPLALMPIHIAFLELIIDPACTLVFEMEEDEKDIMQRKPRAIGDPLFGRQMVFNGLIQGLGVLAVVALIYGLSLNQGYPAEKARWLSFISLVIGNLGLIFTNRSWTRPILATLRIPNKALWWVTGGALAFLTIVSIVPYLNTLFGFAAFWTWELAACLAAGGFSILVSESVKLPVFQRLSARLLRQPQNTEQIGS